MMILEIPDLGDLFSMLRDYELVKLYRELLEESDAICEETKWGNVALVVERIAFEEEMGVRGLLKFIRRKV